MKMVDFKKALIERLCGKELDKKLDKPELAKKLGITKSVISAYETELRSPSYEVLVSISKTFKVSIDYLLGLDPPDRINLFGLTSSEQTPFINLIRSMKSKV